MSSIGRAIFFSLWHQERTPTLFHPNCKALMGSHALSAWETATNELIITCVWWKHMKKKMADTGNHALSIYYGKNISFSNKNHTSLISQHERKQSRRWQKRHEMQMKQQTRRTSETAARRENTDWAKGPEPRSRKEGDEEMQRQRKRRRPGRGRAG